MNKVDPFAATGRERKSLILRELGLPILFGAAVLLISATMLLGVNISAMQNDVTRIQNIQKILLVISDAEAGVVGEQLTVRSYALTGDKRFLDFQNNERVKLVRAINQLEPLAVVEPGGAERVRQIRAWIDQHMALWASLRGIGPDRADILGRAIENPNKRKIMLGTRKMLSDYRADEVRALGARQEQLTQQLARAFVLGIGIIIAAFVLGGLGLIAGQFRIPTKLR
jgi:CHASE3 domain sensor protein